MIEVPQYGFGVHLMVDAFGCNREKLMDIGYIHDFLAKYPPQMDMTIIMPPYVSRYSSGIPEKWGYSGFVLIAESHIAIHTYPDELSMSVDMFSCKPFDTGIAVDTLREYFEFKRCTPRVVDRGHEFPRSIIESEQVVRVGRMLQTRRGR